MMKRILLLLAAAALLLSLAACKKDKKDLVFYVVDGASVGSNMNDAALLRLAKSEGRAAFSGEDIKGWHWQTQQVQLQNVKVRGGADNGGSPLFQADADDAFILTLGNKVIYAGGFAPRSGAVQKPRDPYIEDGEGDTFYLRCTAQYAAGEDPRNQTALYDFLVDRNLLVSELRSEE